MWIFQKLDLYQINAKFWKTMCTQLHFMWICCNTNFTGSRWLGNPQKVTVQWEDECAMEILRRKTEEVSYHLREMDQYEDQ